MKAKKSHKGFIPRVTPTEMYPRVGDNAAKLKAVIPVFGEEIIKVVADAVGSGKIRKGELTLVNVAEPSQTLTVAFVNASGNRDLKIQLSGDWTSEGEIHLDTPLFSPVQGIIYRKRRPNDEKPIAQEGKRLGPGEPICAISQTKSNIWYLELPAEAFPKGGILTKFVVSDGKETKKGDVLCYIKKIE